MENEDLSKTEIIVNNAGLILVWPFLTRLFEQLLMVENGRFSHLAKQNRAIYLLQHLAYGTIEFPEYELVLNKILVGMPISDHVNQIEFLSLEEVAMTDSLMKGLIANWQKVQNSSIEGIQETFMQREGILSLDDTNFKLVLSRKTVDILVEAIPWNLSIIKLPWMEKPLIVEWI